MKTLYSIAALFGFGLATPTFASEVAVNEHIIHQAYDGEIDTETGVAPKVRSETVKTVEHHHKQPVYLLMRSGHGIVSVRFTEVAHAQKFKKLLEQKDEKIWLYVDTSDRQDSSFFAWHPLRYYDAYDTWIYTSETKLSERLSDYIVKQPAE